MPAVVPLCRRRPFPPAAQWLAAAMAVCLSGPPGVSGWGISEIAPTNAPNGGVNMVTVFGKGLGPVTQFWRLRVGGTACATHVWLSDSSVAAAIPPSGPEYNARAVVTLQTMDISTLTNAWTYDTPSVSSATPQTADADAGASGSIMTVFGEGFGSYESSQRMRLGDSAAVCTTWVSSSSVYARIPNGAHFLNGKAASVVLSVIASTGNPKNRRAELSKAFTYALPSITHVQAGGDAPANTPALGGSMTVSGQSFGTSDYSLEISVGSSRASHCMWKSDTSIVAVVAPGFADSLDVTVEIDRFNPPAGQGSGLEQVFYYDLPVVTGVGVGNGPATGAITMSVYGLNFGGGDYTQVVDIDGVMCSQSRWTSDSSLSCETPASKGPAKSIGVDVQGKTGSMSQSFSYNAPSVVKLSSDTGSGRTLVGNGPSFGNVPLIVEGSNFGTAASGTDLVARVHSELGGGDCQLTVWTSDSMVQCFTSSGTGHEAAVSVNLLGQSGTLTECYSYDIPSVQRAGAYLGPWTYAQAFANLPAGVPSQMSIVGRNFGTDDYSPHARVGGTACITTVWHSDSALMCKVRGGHSKSNSVVVSVAKKIGSLTGCITFDSPLIESLVPRNAPAGGAVSVTMSGKNFGMAQYSQTATFSGTAIRISWTSDSSIVGIVPPGRGVALDVTVQQYHDTSTPSNVQSTTHYDIFTYDDPSITAMKPANGPTTGNFVLSLSGASFSSGSDPTQNQPTVMVGDTPCTSVLWNSDTSIQCTASAGIGAVDVTVDLQTQGCTANSGSCITTSTSPLRYDGPHPGGVQGENVFPSPSTGGGTLTVTGTLFGAMDHGPLLKAKIGPTDCPTTTWVSATSLLCVVPEGVGTRDVVVELAGSQNTLSDAFSYEAPTVTDVAPRNGPGSGKAALVVLGEKFGHSVALEAPTIEIGGRAVMSPALASSSQMMCQSPPGFRVPGSGLEITFRSVGAPRDQAKSLSGRFVYDNPLLTKVIPYVVSGISGGSSLTVIGQNFGGVDSSPAVFLGTLDGDTGRAPVACSTSTWLSDSSIRCVSPRTGMGSRDVHFLAAGALGKDSLASLQDTLNDAAGDGSLGGTFALTLAKGVEFVNLPVNMSTGTYDLDCSTGVVEWNAGDELEGVSFALGPSFCGASESPSAMVYTLEFGPSISNDNTILPVSVIVGLHLLGLDDAAGYISVTFPLSLGRISRRRKLLQSESPQVGGFHLRSAYLDQCEGRWVAICTRDSYNPQTGKLTANVPAEVLKDECSGGLVEPRRCSDRVSEDYFCGGGILLSALAYKEDPCLEPNDIGLLPIILGSVGGFLLLLFCTFLAIRQLRISKGGDSDDSRSMGSSYSGSVDQSDLYDSRKYDSRNYDSYDAHRKSPRMDPALYSRRSPAESWDSRYNEMPGPYSQFSYPSSRAYTPPDGSPDFPNPYGGMPNPNYMGVMGPMGVGYGGPIDQYGRPSSRPMTPTGGMQLGMMPGMGAMRGDGQMQARQPATQPWQQGPYPADQGHGEMSYFSRRL